MRSAQAPAHHRAVGFQWRVAMGDGNPLAAHPLPDDLVVAHIEAAFGDMREQGRGRERYSRIWRAGRCARCYALGQMLDGVPELPGKIAMGDNTVAGLGAVEAVMAAEGAEDHLGMAQEIPVDRNLNALDGKGFCPEPLGIGMVRRLARRAFA
jgi:hypothetical protein